MLQIFKFGRKTKVFLGLCCVYVGGGYVSDIDTGYVGGVNRFSRDVIGLAKATRVYKMKLRGLPENSPEREAALEEAHQLAAQYMLQTVEKNSGLYIKLGQLLGQMVHLVPNAYIETLKVLFDKAPKRDFESVRQTFREELGSNPEDLFDEFNPEPIASASLAQVYRARLKNSDQYVAVKVQHRDLLESVNIDLSTVRLLIKFVNWWFPKVDYRWFIEEAESNISQELDFELEAQNCERCRKMFSSRHDVIVPRVHKDLSTVKILTMDFIDGTPLHDTHAIKSQADTKKVSELIMDVFYTMIYHHGFIHSDPHPGNVLLLPGNELKIALLDHGLYRPMDPEFRINYCKLWLSVIDGDINDIKKHCEELNVTKYWHFFISMLTLRAWKSGEEIQNDTATKSDIQHYAKEYFLEISNTLSEMPREFALVFKTRDCLMALNERLGVTHDPDLYVAKYCVDEIYGNDAGNIWSRLYLSWLRMYYYFTFAFGKSWLSLS